MRPGDWVPDSTARSYDNAGNVARGYEAAGKRTLDGRVVIGQEVESRSWYSAEDRLVAMQKYIVTDTGDSIANEAYRVSAVWEEYRYDPLGRRILVRTSGRCRIDDATCGGTVTRWVWMGWRLS